MREPIRPAQSAAKRNNVTRAMRGSWPSATGTATSHKPTSRSLALMRPFGVPLLPCLADLLLLGWRYRAALEDSSQEQPDQDSWKISPHYSIT